MPRVRYQGELNILCGVYAVVNALQKCGIQNVERVFELACEELPPHAVTKGTYLADMKRMLHACRNLRGVSQLSWSYPFEDNPVRDDEHFWHNFRMMMEATDTECAIIGMNRPRYHWTVVTKDGGRWRFYDSIDGKYTKNAARVKSGKRHADQKVWLLDRTDVILIQRARKSRPYRGPPW